MLSNRSLSRCLQSGYHCYKKAKNLNTESEARLRKICSITILLRIVHKAQDIAANMSQKRRLLPPVRFARTSRNSPRSKACHSGPRASATKLHKKQAAGQVKIMWRVVSGTSQRGHRPLPGPCHFATSTAVGRRSRSNCHTNILVLRGSGAFHNGDVHARTGPLHRAR
jgi:hypothetical protein